MTQKLHPSYLLSILLLLTIIACAGVDQTKTPSPSPTIDDTSWRMASIDTPTGDQFPGVDLRTVTVAFKEGMISGTSGCNSFSSTYSTSGSQLSVGKQMMQTLMACPDVLMSLESIVTKGLMSITSYAIEADQLILEGEGYRMVFDPQPDY